MRILHRWRNQMKQLWILIGYSVDTREGESLRFDNCTTYNRWYLNTRLRRYVMKWRQELKSRDLIVYSLERQGTVFRRYKICYRIQYYLHTDLYLTKSSLTFPNKWYWFRWCVQWVDELNLCADSYSESDAHQSPGPECQILLYLLFGIKRELWRC